MGPTPSISEDASRSKSSSYLTPLDVANRLNLSRSSVYSLLRSGELPSLRFSGSKRSGVYRIHTEDLTAFENKLRNRPPNRFPAAPATLRGSVFQILNGARLASRRPANDP